MNKLTEILNETEEYMMAGLAYDNLAHELKNYLMFHNAKEIHIATVYHAYDESYECYLEKAAEILKVRVKVEVHRSKIHGFCINIEVDWTNKSIVAIMTNFDNFDER